MDLVRFELTTSSMPFKKYQSLAGIFTRNKRLSGGRFGRRWTPQTAFLASELARGLQSLGTGAGRVSPCALHSTGNIPTLDICKATAVVAPKPLQPAFVGGRLAGFPYCPDCWLHCSGLRHMVNAHRVSQLLKRGQRASLRRQAISHRRSFPPYLPLVDFENAAFAATGGTKFL